MMCLQLPAVNKPSQHPGPHWLGWLRVAPRALHSIPPPSSISIFSPLIFHSYSFFFFPFLPLFSLFYLPSYSASFLESFPLFCLSLIFTSPISQASSSHAFHSVSVSISLSESHYTACQSILPRCLSYLCTGLHIPVYRTIATLGITVSSSLQPSKSALAVSITHP